MSGKRLVLIVSAIVGALLLMLGGVGFYLVGQAKSSDAVTVDAAVAKFHERDDGTRDIAGAPEPGVYTYAAVGSEAGGAASINVTRDLPAEAQMMVWQQPGGFETELVYSGDHREGARYAVGDDGIAQTWTRTKLSLLGTTSDTDADITPAGLWIAKDLSVGAAWDSTYEADGSTTSYSSKVTGTENVTIGTDEVATVVVERTTKIAGNVTGQWTDTYWWSTELNMPVKMSVEGDSKEGIGTFSQSSTLTLVAGEPRL